jgi:hypothetical protein
MAAMPPIRRRAAAPVSARDVAALTMLMKAAVKAVVDIPGTCSDRIAFICKPIAIAFRATMM